MSSHHHPSPVDAQYEVDVLVHLAADAEQTASCEQREIVGGTAVLAREECAQCERCDLKVKVLAQASSLANVVHRQRAEHGLVFDARTLQLTNLHQQLRLVQPAQRARDR